MGRESKIESTVRDYAIQRRVRYVKLTTRKYPDRMLIGTRGRVAFIEFKRPGGRYQPGQEDKLAELRERGFIAVKVDTFQYAQLIVDLLVDP